VALEKGIEQSRTDQNRTELGYSDTGIQWAWLRRRLYRVKCSYYELAKSHSMKELCGMRLRTVPFSSVPGFPVLRPISIVSGQHPFGFVREIVLDGYALYADGS